MASPHVAGGAAEAACAGAAGDAGVAGQPALDAGASRSPSPLRYATHS